MSNKPQKNNRIPKKPVQQAKVILKPEYPAWLNYAAVVGILAIVFWCYHYSFGNQFTIWDDDIYVTDNPFIKALNWVNLKAIFTQVVTENNYHPLTIISLAINYHFAQLSPTSYYFTNIFLHLANVVFVFMLAKALFSKLEYVSQKGVLLISSVSALWFGIHPMHVESVSWIAERKDVLYTFFYLLALISYVRFISTNNQKTYILMLVLFIASCLSKAMAVVFPLSLFCIDFLLKRKWNTKLILEKIPVLLVAFIFGLLAVHFQKQANAITSFANIPIAKRAMFASYGLVMYVVKFFMPTHLSTFYPYPCINNQLYVDMPLPLFYYFSFWIALLIIVVPVYIAYKANNNYFRIVVFGLGFFLANIVFELQFISVGRAIMADRYSYVAYIGLLFVVAFFLHEIIKRVPVLKLIVIVLIITSTGVLAYLTSKRTEVWQNSEGVFKDAIEQYHDRIALFYKALGDYYHENNQPENAIIWYKEYARLNNDDEVLNDLGNLYKSIKDYPNAAKYYTKLLFTDAPKPTTLAKVSEAWATAGQDDSAIVYYKKAVALDASIEKLYTNISDAYLNIKQYQKAIYHYDVLVNVYPENPYYYYNRGLAKYYIDDKQGACNDWLLAQQYGSPNAAAVLKQYCR